MTAPAPAPSSAPSTIDVLNAVRNGQELPQPVTAPKPVFKAAATAPLMTEAQLAERETIRAKLQVGTWIIEFNKIDGTKSIMEATLDPRLLPAGDPSATPAPAEAAHILRVYAIDRQGWRSFVVPNLTRIYQAAENL
jgi:hypothetical protein